MSFGLSAARHVVGETPEEDVMWVCSHWLQAPTPMSLVTLHTVVFMMDRNTFIFQGHQVSIKSVFD